MDFRFLVPTLALVLAACSADPPEPAATSVAAPADAPADAREPDEYEADDVLLRDHDVAHVVVKEAFVTASTPEENIDSPASWLQDGKRMLVASAKATDQLVVYDGDTGQRLRTVGGTGTALGQLQRPNGVATIDDRYLFVVERDTHRVQMFQLPDFTPLLAFDDSGGRLGQGGGFYDRTFAARPNVTRIGLAYAGQAAERLPMQRHDMALDGVLTETGYTAFK